MLRETKFVMSHRPYAVDLSSRRMGMGGDPVIETVRLSQTARGQLIALKGRTGIKNWNTPCRWALALSLAEPPTSLTPTRTAEPRVTGLKLSRTATGIHRDALVKVDWPEASTP